MAAIRISVSCQVIPSLETEKEFTVPMAMQGTGAARERDAVLAGIDRLVADVRRFYSDDAGGDR